MTKPYLSVVVTTRNDNHGGNPLGRFQAFINCLIAQCRRVGLQAELIVVEWNPPVDRPPLRNVLTWPVDPLLEIRIIQVPPALHATLNHADALPLFQMIAKNVGIRRARGEFVLSTNIDILLSNALIDTIASRKLQPGVMYRVDRHDVDTDVPVDGALDQQLDYCRTHQLRVNGRWGTFPVTPTGDPDLWPDDIVDRESGIRLGKGWHAREGAVGAPLRWVSERAEVTIGPFSIARSLNVEVESNPYVPQSQVVFSIADPSAGQLLMATRVSNVYHDATTLQVTIPPATAPRELIFEGRSSGGRDWLPPGEDRDGLVYRIRRLSWDSQASRSPYSLDRWRLSPDGGATINRTDAGVSVVTSPRNLLYAIEYAPFVAPATGTFLFWMTLTLADGGIIVQALDEKRAQFLPLKRRFFKVSSDRSVCEMRVDLIAGQTCTLVISNAREDGDRASHFVIHDFYGDRPPNEIVVPEPPPAAPTPWRRLKSIVKRWIGRESSTSEPVSENQVPTPVETEPPASAPATPTWTNPVEAFLVANRLERLHLNACGDFQLMSRADWIAIGGYAEFQMYSMNIDGLLGQTARYAGLREDIFQWPACVYHIEHEAGSGWTPHGEEKLRKRISERGIGWLDHAVVSMLASFMKSVGRPLIFNDADWGFAQHQLPEVVVSDDAVIQ